MLSSRSSINSILLTTYFHEGLFRMWCVLTLYLFSNIYEKILKKRKLRDRHPSLVIIGSTAIIHQQSFKSLRLVIIEPGLPEWRARFELMRYTTGPWLRTFCLVTKTLSDAFYAYTQLLIEQRWEINASIIHGGCYNYEAECLTKYTWCHQKY